MKMKWIRVEWVKLKLVYNELTSTDWLLEESASGLLKVSISMRWIEWTKECIIE